MNQYLVSAFLFVYLSIYPPPPPLSQVLSVIVLGKSSR